MLIWLAVAFSVLGVGDFYVRSPPSRHPHHHPIKITDWSAEHAKRDAGKGVVWPWSLNAFEEDENKEIYNGTENDLEKFRSEQDGLLHLPGGCEITTAQYQKLQEFRRGAHYVQHCYCQEGAVYCKLKQGGQHVQIT